MTRHIMQQASIGSLLFALAVAGCSSPSDSRGDTNSDGAVATGEQVIDGLMGAYCDLALKCGGVPYSDRETCVAFLSAGEQKSFDSPYAVRETFNSGKATTTTGALADCVAAIRAGDCEVGFEGDFRTFPACDTAFTGHVADGQACVTDIACGHTSRCFRVDGEDECAAKCEALGTRCRQDSDCAGGKVCDHDELCVTPASPPGGSGADCSGEKRCQTGLVCLVGTDQNEQTTYTCGALSAVGGSCDRDGHCQRGLECNYDTYPGKCEMPPPPIAEGQPCTPEGGRCAMGLVCVPANDLQSAACLKPVTKGEACSKVLECGGLYGLYICDMTSKKCVARPTSGPCPIPQAAAGCDLFTSYCDTTSQQSPKCMAVKGPGASCTEGYECGGVNSGSRCERGQNPESGGTCVTPDPVVCNP